MKRIVLVAAMVVGCGSELTVVDFDMTCPSVTCHGADDVDKTDIDGDELVTCSWLCVEYDGDPDRAVTMVFGRRHMERCWTIDEERVDEGLCR